MQATVVNYQLDLEVQWLNANYTRTNEYLCIYTGTLNSENLRVDVWTGSSWTTVITALTANAWNNVSVSDYLTSSTFTIRFKGTEETNDATQSSWQIDCVLLHTWTGGLSWHSVETWFTNLLVMMWRSVETWNIQLLTMNWNNIESWLISVHPPKWFDVETWIFNLWIIGWREVETWNIQLIQKMWRDVENWFINLLTMNWNDVENWFVSFLTMSWHDVEVYFVKLWTMAWRTVEEWNFQFIVLVCHTIEEWFVKFWTLEMKWNFVEQWFFSFWTLEAIYIPTPTIKWGMVFSLAVVFAVVLALMFEEEKKK
jgi:hypothetical protein